MRHTYPTANSHNVHRDLLLMNFGSFWYSRTFFIRRRSVSNHNSDPWRSEPCPSDQDKHLAQQSLGCSVVGSCSMVWEARNFITKCMMVVIFIKIDSRESLISITEHAYLQYSRDEDMMKIWRGHSTQIVVSVMA